jgi:hypothetical protein
MDLYEAYVRPDRRSAKSKHKASQLHSVLERERQFGDFQCQHCHLHVSADPLRSGVNNRNHCPYCLWSKHVDLYESGDRLAACKGAMQPVGLTFKRRQKKYASRQPGEMMLLHQCTACGALSINRLAADDTAASLWEVYEASSALSPGVRALAAAEGIDLLGSAERELVQARLPGGDS